MMLVAELGEVFGPCADVHRNRLAGSTIVCAHEATFGSESERNEARVTNDDALQAFELIDAQRPGPSFADRFSPTSGT